jgi:hypothetical protein
MPVVSTPNSIWLVENDKTLFIPENKKYNISAMS